MKKMILIILMAALLLPLAACGAGTPDDTVTKYFAAAQKFRDEEMDIYMLPTDEKDTSETTGSDDFSDFSEFTNCFVDYAEANAAKMTYKITDSSVNGDNAAVTVNCRYVDGSTIYKEAMQKFYAKTIAGALTSQDVNSLSEINQILTETMEEQINKTPETFKEVTLTMNCVRKDNVWYIAKENEEMEDILLCGFISAMKDLDLDGNTQADDTPDMFTDAASDVIDSLFKVIDKGLGYLS